MCGLLRLINFTEKQEPVKQHLLHCYGVFLMSDPVTTIQAKLNEEIQRLQQELSSTKEQYSLVKGELKEVRANYDADVIKLSGHYFNKDKELDSERERADHHQEAAGMYDKRWCDEVAKNKQAHKQIAVLRNAIINSLNEQGIPNEDYPANISNSVDILTQALSSTPSDMICLTKEELNAPSRELWAAMADAFLLTHDKHHDVAIMAIYRAAVSQLLKERTNSDEVKES